MTGGIVRPYRPGDWAALYEICVGTGLGGADAGAAYSDPQLLPSIYAGPYAALEPELVFVADEGSGPFGYVLGTAATERFVREYRERWLPRVSERFPEPAQPPAAPLPTDAGDPPSNGAVEERMRWLLHHPEGMLRPELVAYPAHLHIDLLPQGQGRGLGRALMDRFLEALRERGVSAVHLGVNPANVRARAFYDRLGFHEIDVQGTGGGALFLGRALGKTP